MYVTGDAKWCMLTRAVVAAVALAVDLNYLEETLPPSERSITPITMADASPFKFLTLFTKV
jgi:hypothetical protein